MIKCLLIAIVHYPQLKVLADLGMGRSGGLFPSDAYIFSARSLRTLQIE